MRNNDQYIDNSNKNIYCITCRELDDDITAAEPVVKPNRDDESVQLVETSQMIDMK